MAELTRKEVVFILNNSERPRIAGLDLSGLDLSHFDFSRSDCSHANFRGSNVIGAIFYNANLERATFENANLTESNLGEATLRYTIFDRANLYRANMQFSRPFALFSGSIDGCSFHDANLQEANFTSMRIENVDFSGASLKNAKFDRAVFDSEDTKLTKEQLAMIVFDFMGVGRQKTGFDRIFLDKNGDYWIGEDHPKNKFGSSIPPNVNIWIPFLRTKTC